ncbi:MAG: hypothetical protein ACR2LN_03760 [Candidatus Levyibacteriota bacterium]
MRSYQVQQYMQLQRSGHITARNIIGHDDLKPSNYVFNNNSNDDLVLTSVIDYERAMPSTPEQELRRTPQHGDEVLHAAIDEHARLTGIVLDENIIRFWDRVHFVNFASNYALRSSPGDSRQVLSTELQRVYPSNDWREVTGEISYAYSK